MTWVAGTSHFYSGSVLGAPPVTADEQRRNSAAGRVVLSVEYVYETPDRDIGYRRVREMIPGTIREDSSEGGIERVTRRLHEVDSAGDLRGA